MPNYYKKKLLFFPPEYKNVWKECNFYKNKKAFKIDDIDINKILVSQEESYGKKV